MTITIDGKEEIQLQPRAAEILKRLIEQQDEITIEKIPHGHWRCDFAGRKVTPSWGHTSRTTEASAPGVQVKMGR